MATQLSIGQQRNQDLVAQNEENRSLSTPQTHQHCTDNGIKQITYGKTRRPLSLTANQFMRRDPYDIFSQSADEDEAEATGTLHATASGQSSDGDSPLSDTESIGPRRSTSSELGDSAPARDHSRGPREADILEVTARSARKCISSARSKLGIVTSSRIPLAGTPDPTRGDEKTAKQMRRRRSVACAPPQEDVQPSKSRLPTGNELTLVPWCPEEGIFCEPESDDPVSEMQDPISEPTTGQGSHEHRPIRSASTKDEKQTMRPLASSRKRFKSPTLKHKAVKRKRKPTSLFGFSTDREKITTGDGFEPVELHVDFGITLHRRRKRKRTPNLSFGALEVSGGLLPEVIFDCLTDELQLESKGGYHHVSSRLPPTSAQEDYRARSPPPSIPGQRQASDELQQERKDGHHNVSSRGTWRSRLDAARERSNQLKRRVSFSDKEEFIYAQLSSITAPPKPRSDSGEESGDEDDHAEDETDVDEVEGEDLQQFVAGTNGAEDDELVQDDRSTRSLRPTQHEYGEQDANDNLTSNEQYVFDDVEDEPDCDSASMGISEPGYPPKPLFGRQPLIEVDEAIVDVPHRRTSPPTKCETWITEELRGRSYNTPASNESHHRRHGSILKNAIPLVSVNTYRPEDVAGNTRRNSRKLVDVEDSRYFAQAEEFLRAAV